jgi:hypothetical protein
MKKRLIKTFCSKIHRVRKSREEGIVTFSNLQKEGCKNLEVGLSFIEYLH